MQFQKWKNSFVIKDVQDFELVHIFECGQCFRWHKQLDGSYIGVVKGDVIRIKKDDDSIQVETTSSEPVRLIHDYFDFKTDYSKIKTILSKDEVLKKAIEFGYGIRILKQEPWECLVSFIISANNRIPIIIKTVETLARIYGKPIEFDDKTYFSFPEPADLVDVDEDKLLFCGVGFRGKYINKAARMVISGDIDLNRIGEMDSVVGREELMKIPGVGPKVADCVLLYSYGKTDVFPTDVWIKRVIGELYFGREVKLSEIQEFARERFGSLAGFAQQYLFYYARENRIGCR